MDPGRDGILTSHCATMERERLWYSGPDRPWAERGRATTGGLAKHKTRNRMCLDREGVFGRGQARCVLLSVSSVAPYDIVYFELESTYVPRVISGMASGFQSQIFVALLSFDIKNSRHRSKRKYRHVVSKTAVHDCRLKSSLNPTGSATASSREFVCISVHIGGSDDTTGHCQKQMA
jgi:hypothetical protein